MKSNQHATNGTRGIKRIDLAYVELASSENARDINRDIVLEIIRSQQPVARADLARSSGLQPSTISAIVEQLIEEKWVAEGAMARRPRGRPSTLLSLNDAMVILVADVRPNQAIVALVDLNGRFLAREAVPLVSEPARSVTKIVHCMESMRAAHSDRSFEGIGISMPGRVDPETQRLILAPNLKWSDYDIKGAIEEQMQLQVELANAANACLLSELWSGRLDGIRNAVLITVSEGIGGAILANGQIITSRSGLAGEFGHSPIDPTGPVCGCGQRGCWEVFASSTAALRYYAELAAKDTTHTASPTFTISSASPKKATRPQSPPSPARQPSSAAASVSSPPLSLPKSFSSPATSPPHGPASAPSFRKRWPPPCSPAFLPSSASPRTANSPASVAQQPSSSSDTPATTPRPIWPPPAIEADATQPRANSCETQDRFDIVL